MNAPVLGAEVKMCFKWLFGLIAACAVSFAQAQAYPARPITMIVPLQAGSSLDVVIRIVAQKMSESLGQQIVAENQPGAAGAIGAERVMRATLCVERVMRDTLGPDKVNLAALGNMVAHLHWHVIPRWKDDPHFPQAIWAALPEAAPGAPQAQRARRDATIAGLPRFHLALTDAFERTMSGAVAG